MHSLKEQFGNIDIYLFDQLLKGRIKPSMTILDAGCGHGRNCQYLLQEGYDIHALDQNPQYLSTCKTLFEHHAPDKVNSHLHLRDLRSIDFSEKFDFIICNAVMHFVEDQACFDDILNRLWRALRSNGILFIRLSTRIGFEHLIVDIGNGRYRLPAGNEWFLPSEDDLLQQIERLPATLLDPIKTTNVQNLRTMTTLVLQK